MLTGLMLLFAVGCSDAGTGDTGSSDTPAASQPDG